MLALLIRVIFVDNPEFNEIADATLSLLASR